MARTAVVAGTATAVSGRVARRQADKYADKDAEIYAKREASYEQQVAGQQQAAAPPPPPPPAATAPADEMVTKLHQLADLHTQGILSDEEFAAAKAKLLNA